jgi:hypothetical protein
MNISQTILFLTIGLATAYAIPHDSSQFAFQAGGIRVPVELGVMSRCIENDSAISTFMA